MSLAVITCELDVISTAVTPSGIVVVEVEERSVQA